MSTTCSGAPVRRATNYRARPEDGAKRYAIAADRMLLDGYDRLKRRLGLKEDSVHKVLEGLARIRGKNKRR